MTSNRESILKKIRALMAKTIENGCTEAETMSALSMASAMMDAYEVTEADLQDTKTESAIKEEMKDMRDPHHIRSKITVAISKFTNTKCYRSEYKPQKYKYNFVGLASDVEFAIWLTETLTMFIQKELKTYIWSNNYTPLPPNVKRPIIMGFVLGCANRINDRLLQLVASSEVKASSNGNALVVIKHELIQRKMNELGLNLRQPRARGTHTNHDAYGAGKAAGERASFGRPVGAGAVTSPPRNHQFGVGIERGPSPDITSAIRRGLGAAHVLVLGVAERPNFIALDTLGGDVADHLVVEVCASHPRVHHQLGHGIDRDAADPRDRAERRPFDQHRKDLDTLGYRKFVHAEHDMNLFSYRQA